MVSVGPGITPAISTARSLKCCSPEGEIKSKNISFGLNDNEQQSEKSAQSMSTAKKAAIGIAALAAACLTRGTFKTQFKGQKPLTVLKDIVKNANPFTKDFFPWAKTVVPETQINVPKRREKFRDLWKKREISRRKEGLVYRIKDSIKAKKAKPQSTPLVEGISATTLHTPVSQKKTIKVPTSGLKMPVTKNPMPRLEREMPRTENPMP